MWLHQSGPSLLMCNTPFTSEYLCLSGGWPTQVIEVTSTVSRRWCFNLLTDRRWMPVLRNLKSQRIPEVQRFNQWASARQQCHRVLWVLPPVIILTYSAINKQSIHMNWCEPMKFVEMDSAETCYYPSSTAYYHMCKQVVWRPRITVEISNDWKSCIFQLHTNSNQ